MIDGLIDVVELNGDLVDYISLEGTLLPIGPKGDKGDPGEPGFSPQVDITKVGKATTLTIVDEEGTHQSVIYDGDGDMNKAVYDTDNDGIVDNAERVNGYTVATNVPADAQFTDTTYTAGVGIEITAGNVINNTQTSAEWGNISGDLEDQIDLQNALDNKADASDIPDSTSDLTNDSGFITNTANDLINYYLKSETYTKSEVNNLISQIPGFAIQVVQTLPVSDIDTHTIYLVPSSSAGTQNVYDEFIYINNAWEQIGSTEVDLSNYYTKTESDSLLGNKVGFSDYASSNSAGVVRANNSYGFDVDSTYGSPNAHVYTYNDYQNRPDNLFVSKGTLDNVLDGKSYATTTALTNGLATKQDTLVSGTNIKTINSTSLLGSGDIEIEAEPEVMVQTTTPTEGKLWLNPNTNGVGNGFILNRIYPIGSIYINTTGVNPGTFLGGTWASFGAGKVLVGQDTNDTDFDTLLETGGSKELQEHSHILGKSAGAGSQTDWAYNVSNVSNAGAVSTQNAGTGNSGNLQPYIVVSIWVRTA